MKLAIFAATGGIGRQMLNQAIVAGHDVTAVVRNPHKLADKGARTLKADLEAPDQAVLEAAVAGADAVLSGLGPRVMNKPGVAERGTRAIVNAMKAKKVRRIVVVSAAPIATVPSPGRPNPPKHNPGDGFFMRNLGAPLAKTVMRKRYANLALMEDVLRDSDLDWTVVRPPRLTDKPKTGSYRTAYGRNLRRGSLISRGDVADFMLRVIGQSESIRQTVGIAY
jgi:putative NADH-flavin reductase